MIDQLFTKVGDAVMEIYRLRVENSILREERDRALEWRDKDWRAHQDNKAMRYAMTHALERLDASLFTNAEHRQAKDILRSALGDDQ
jgi:hypothetical protein